MRIVVRVLITAAALAVAAWLLDGIRFAGPANGWPEVQEKIVPLLVVALILAAVTSFVRPVLTILSLPLVLLTLGLFLLVINALMLMLTGWLAGQLDLGFTVGGFWAALWGSIIITVVTWLIDAFVDND